MANEEKIRVINDTPSLTTDGQLVHILEMVGPSSASKPTTGLGNGSLFVESDTGYVYLYDEDAGWGDAIGSTPSQEAVDAAVSAWLSAHPEATTTVEDGAVTNAKLASSFVTPGTADEYSSSSTYAVGDYAFYGGTLYKCKTAITTAEAWTAEHWEVVTVGADLAETRTAINFGADVLTPFDADSWTAGYLGTTKIGASSTDVYNTVPYPVMKGDVIDVKLAIPLSQTKAYFYYAWCNANKTYSTRNGGTATYNDSDANYRYYTETITAPADGYFLMSHRTYSVDWSASTLTITRKKNDISVLNSDMATAKADITALKAHADEDMYYRFPSGDELPIDVCHRGLCAEGLPENTLTAFAACKAAGWKWVETDIRLTSDEKWVCLHDPSINRTARNADGTTIETTTNIADITFAEALTYDFGIYAGAQYAGIKILTFDDFLNFCSKARLYAHIEVKSSSWSAEQMATAFALVQKYHMENKVMWIGSSYGMFDDILALYPQAGIMFTGSSAWTPIDPDEFASNPPTSYLNAMTGKNKIFWEKIMTGFTDLAAQENFIDYCHYWGIYPGTYCPTSKEHMDTLSPRFDMVTAQYVKYSDAQAETLATI